VAEIDKEEIWKKWLSRWFLRRVDGSGDGKAGPSPRGLVLLILLGAALMLLSSRLAEEPAAPSGAPTPDEGAVETLAAGEGELGRLAREVAALLSQLAGVGAVEVLIVPATSETLVFAEEVVERRSSSENQPQGGAGRAHTTEEQITRRTVIYRAGDGRGEEPLVRYRERPKIAGVLVAAQGAADPKTRLLLLEAVSTVLDVPAHRVQIVERKR